MALVTDTFGIGEGIAYDGSTLFTIYGKMFDPNVPDAPSSYSTVSLVNPSTSYNLLGFQPGLEVCVCCLEVGNQTSSTISGNASCTLKQYKSGSYVAGTTMDFGYYNIEQGWWFNWYMRVGIDPDEIRPGITQYRFERNVCGQTFTKDFSVSNLSFDTTPHDAGYLRVQGNNLCYVPPSIYSGSSTTGYKHIIDYDTGYSGANAGTDAKGSIWIPSSSSDHHIYYVTQNGYVYRTKESYAWNGGSSSAGSNKSGFIRMTPSTSSRPEQAGYNYLCYVDGGGYKRRMGVGEI